MKRIFSTVLGAGILLSGCATAMRGTHTDFQVVTAVPGAKVETTVETQSSRAAYSWRDRRDAFEGKAETPQFTYQGCEPTPCTLRLPRKSDFMVLVTQDGHEPKIAKINRIHKDDAKKLVMAGNVTVIGASAASGAAAAAAYAELGGLFATGAFSATLVAVATVPALIGIGIATDIDRENGANYDFTPNPLELELLTTDSLNLENPEKIYSDFLNTFRSLQAQYSLHPKLNDMCYKGRRRISCEQLGKIEKRTGKETTPPPKLDGVNP